MTIAKHEPIEQHPLQPFLPPHARLLMLGSFPPPKTRWSMDFYYPNLQNDMWRIFGCLFFDDKNYFVDVANKTFKENELRRFLTEKGIAIFDTACQVRRLKGNASDQFLEIVQHTDLVSLLKDIPDCHTIMTTGEKATASLMQHFPDDTAKPQIGQFIVTTLMGRELHVYRMPSSSRAYPLPLMKKVEAYRVLFENLGFIPRTHKIKK